MSQATLGSGPYRNSSLFSGYYLDERVADLDDWESDDEAEAAFEDLRNLWEPEGEYVASHGEDELIDQWIGEVLEILGFDTISEGTLPDGGGYVDRLLYESREDRYAAADRKREGDQEGMFAGASALLEAKQWGHNFEQRFRDERPYRDASHQVKYYLERTPSDLNWGILTDGKKWRLYGTKDYETQTYYEVDLPELLESGNLQQFKYFYCFFRPEAFIEIGGSSFLETVWSESETAAQELGEDLQDNVFTALRVLGKGFVENNDPGIDPEDESARDELKEQSLVLLYRLMFVLYAESRGLIDPEAPSANAEYHENFSLDEVRSDIIETVEGGDVESGAVFRDEYSTFSTTIWNRLTRLFELIDEGEEALDIPPYNGGLFDHDDHEFLAENSVSDPAIAEVIFRLSTTENDEGEYVPADYADLDTRHLGSIYEGLLEHEFRIAGPEGVAAVAEDGGQVWKSGDEVAVADAVETVEEGGLYVVSDEGERKATGAYYTPDYVVTYIVEETVDPLIDEIDADLRDRGLEPSDREYFRDFYDAVRDLTVLDPAMGSGHFLTKATGYLTEQVMSVVREQEIQSYDEQDIRRDISKEVIYGVDLNGMAVELAKLSMWLETLAADQPLAFLDHHLKAGNSLVGSDITEVLSEDDGDDDGGQLTLTQAFARVRRDTLEHVMELMSDLLAFDNDSLESVKSMEELYDEIREDPLYTRLFELANVHTAEEFGVDVPEDAYEQMAGAIEDESDWGEIEGEDWFKSAQATADEQDFFHWELEFPEVFFDVDGEKLAGAGFDAVVGNPPYAKIPTELRDAMNPEIANDLYTQFMARCTEITRDEGFLSFITPISWESGPHYTSIRELLFDSGSLHSIVNLPYDVFADAYVDTGMFSWQKGIDSQHCLVTDLSGTRQSPEVALENLTLESVPTEPWRELGFIALNTAWISLYDRIGDRDTVGDHTDSLRGVLVTDDALESDTGSTPILLDSFQRYEDVAPDDTVEYSLLKEAPTETDVFKDSRLLVRRLVSRDDRLLATHATDYFVSKKDVYIFKSDVFDERLLLSLMNSSLLSWWHFNVEMSASKDDFRQVTLGGLRDLPLPEMSDTDFDADMAEISTEGIDMENMEKHDPSEVSEIQVSDPEVQKKLITLTERLRELKRKYQSHNLSLVDHLGNYRVGPQITEIGLTQPAEGSANSVLEETTKEKPSLRVGDSRVICVSPNTILIEATARYKPDDEDAYETDQWGYTETDYLPAFRITDLAETEADLIEHFVPVAVDEAGGFANFRENATKTNSLVDRLQAIELPDVDDVADDLANYLRTVERAEELDEKIAQTDALIDEIVYELYGLTDEEIGIVEEAVGE